ncbi:AFR281Cp [Eremothecium gossypii ATCC 10895]|uniref:Probable kinetochore protein NDC80 n=1 Tax=Eremothecium gossypii (strain ATCC 10895 / CBS 109.51 / FGSC 9923 / NRRL Y-1056) TaxID=284811 RepID=NDC80_EREGS|nr:AFR281Cp [Eremothecium gossypii ATCC 10895]Q753N1.2 RecName: Full=Probable kinetochore protein NDC80 [Eremothecium gossypii ATCC 10895]AAS53652.2 AFR281Cp [Eremothecium gossypii ATCC 10895]AEY97965.1 FAFR281Cp [Eremothecium gossypii FDAG1]
MAERRGSSGANGVLNSLNPQRFTSQIPSIGGNTNKKGVPGTNAALTDMINKSLARNGRSSLSRPVPEVRKSLRRSLRSSQRPSIVPGGGPSAYGALQSTRDPRPLRDKNYQAVLQQEIFDYLQSRKFDIETGHAISLKSLKQPTQKDFICIFRWLYRRLDPGYSFKRSLETEVYSILKTIQYPFLDTINKSQISAVGGSNWHKFLGMLHWLMNTSQRLDSCLHKLDESKTMQLTQDITILNQPVTTLDEQDEKHEQYELMVERLFIEYISKCYKSFINMEDDFSPFKEELEIGFDRFVHIIETDINNLGRQEEMLQQDCEMFAARCEGLKLARSKHQALKGDLVKFQNYINAMKNKAEDWPRKLNQMVEEINEKKGLIKDIHAEIDKLRQALSQEDIQEIDQMNQQRDTFSKMLDTVSSKLDNLTGSVKSQKLNLESSSKVFLDTLEKFNASINGFVLARNNLQHPINPAELLIPVKANITLTDSTAITPSTILEGCTDILSSIKPNLLKVNKEIDERISALQTENNQLEKELRGLRDTITSKGHMLESMENELSNIKSEYDEYQQVSHSKLLSQRIEIEKLERKIQNDRHKTQQRVAQAEQEIEDAAFKLKELTLKIQQERVVLHRKLIKVIEYVVSFKMDVQGSIEALHDFSVEQLESL